MYDSITFEIMAFLIRWTTPFVGLKNDFFANAIPILNFKCCLSFYTRTLYKKLKILPHLREKDFEEKKITGLLLFQIHLASLISFDISVEQCIT